MKKTEILAPAGGTEQLEAAVRTGADAVYLGTKNFNARNSADNFDEASLMQAVQYCHARNVRVYVTMNTLITDDEVNDVVSEIKMIARCGADAVIIQDLAVARLWKEYCPSMPLHASTQMTIHNVAGALQAQELGFKRIVLARELSLEEIRKISQSTQADIEVFVHGALCMSVSGTCLLSSMIGSRSGNRGRCAQPCRLDFKANGREYALSLKDLSLVDKVRELSEAGVDSFKIEGRMKRAEYVAAAVTAVRKSMNNEPYDEEALRAVFSRSGFTKGYFLSQRNLEMFGYRRKEDVTAASGVLKNLAQLYKDEIRKIPVDISFTANENETVLTVTDGTNSVTVNGEKPQKAQNKPLDNEFAEKCLSKLGGTIFVADKFSFSIAEGLAVSASSMNAMRREATEKLYGLRSWVTPYEIVENEAKKTVSAFSSRERTYRLRFEHFAQSFDDERAEKIILPMGEILRHPECVELYGKKLVCELPFLVFAENEDSFTLTLERVRELGVRSVLADNIGTMKIASDMGFAVSAGHGMNILNSVSFSEYEKLGAVDITLSPEISMTQAGRIRGKVKKGILGYGYLPLMRFRACPVQGRNGCADCRGLTVIKDRRDIDFYVICSARKYSTLLNSVPLYVGDKPLEGDFVTLYFTFEKQDKCRKIFEYFINKKSPEMRKTGGLYYRELL